MPYFKVLEHKTSRYFEKHFCDSPSTPGATLSWSYDFLPRRGENGTWTPGPWLTSTSGRQEFYLTSNPYRWWSNNASCYEVEYTDVTGENLTTGSLCCTKVRLIRRLEADELYHYRIFSKGSHTIVGHGAIACGSAVLKVSGRAQFYSFDNARIRSCGNKPNIEAHGRSRVFEYGFPRAVYYGHAECIELSSFLGWIRALASGNLGWAPLVVLICQFATQLLCARSVGLSAAGTTVFCLALLLSHLGAQASQIQDVCREYSDDLYMIILAPVLLMITLFFFALTGQCTQYHLCHGFLASWLIGMALDFATVHLVKRSIERFDYT